VVALLLEVVKRNLRRMERVDPVASRTMSARKVAATHHESAPTRPDQATAWHVPGNGAPPVGPGLAVPTQFSWRYRQLSMA
jgi:hypothetical protein